MGRVSSHVVSRQSWSPCCCGFRGVFSVGRIFSCFFFFGFFFPRTQTACCKCASFTSLLPACSAMDANVPQPRTLEVSLVWARDAVAMRTYNNVALYVLSLWFIKMRCGSHAFLRPQYKNQYFQKSKPFMRLSLSGIFVGMTSPRHQVQPLKSLTSYRR